MHKRKLKDRRVKGEKYNFWSKAAFMALKHVYIIKRNSYIYSVKNFLPMSHGITGSNRQIYLT